jgi:hypothetical protein
VRGTGGGQVVVVVRRGRGRGRGQGALGLAAELAAEPQGEPRFLAGPGATGGVSSAAQRARGTATSQSINMYTMATTGYAYYINVSGKNRGFMAGDIEVPAETPEEKKQRVLAEAKARSEAKRQAGSGRKGKGKKGGGGVGAGAKRSPKPTKGTRSSMR